MKKFNIEINYDNGTKYLYTVTFEDRGIKYCYVGIQYGKKANPKNLGVRYFTSSNRVKGLIKKFDITQFSFNVRTTFPKEFSVEKLLDIEFRYIKHLKRKYPDTCLNQFRRGTDNSKLNLKGAANPAYGSSRSKGLILIHNPITQFQKRVYQDEIDNYLSIGWVKGANISTKDIASKRVKKQIEKGTWVNPLSKKESIRKMSETQKQAYSEGRRISPCKGKFGKDHPSFGIKQTDFQKQKAREATQKDWIIINPQGEQFRITNLRQFCLENSLDQGNMANVARGKLNHYKRWKCLRIE